MRENNASIWGAGDSTKILGFFFKFILRPEEEYQDSFETFSLIIKFILFGLDSRIKKGEGIIYCF